jgi:hypothetical protein
VNTTRRMKNRVRASFSRTTCLVSIKRGERIDSKIMDHESLITSLEIAGATATLRFKPNVRYQHIFVHGLAHIVDRERGYRSSSERFHFNAGLGVGSGGCNDSDAVISEVEPHVGMIKWKRMTQWDQLRGALGSHYASQSCGFERIAFGRALRANRFNRCR